MAEGKAKPLKKEEEEEDGDVPLSAVLRAKAVKKEEPHEDEEEEEEDNLPLALSKSKIKKSKSLASKIKKEEDLDQGDDDKDQMVKNREDGKNKGKPVAKLKKRRADNSEDEDFKDKKKKKKKQQEEKKVVGKKGKGSIVGKEKVKKVYDFPGQKHDPPQERDPLRIFYETLYNQVPDSEMAAFWMMEWGLLPLNEAKKVYEKKIKKAQQHKLGSPVKAISVKKTSNATAKQMSKMVLKTETKVSKKRKASNSETDDDDFIVLKKTKKQKASS